MGGREQGRGVADRGEFDAASRHPVARAVTEAWAGPRADVNGFKSLTGRGVEGTIAGETYFVGNHRLAEERKGLLAGSRSGAGALRGAGEDGHRRCIISRRARHHRGGRHSSREQRQRSAIPSRDRRADALPLGTINPPRQPSPRPWGSTRSAAGCCPATSSLRSNACSTNTATRLAWSVTG